MNNRNKVLEISKEMFSARNEIVEKEEKDEDGDLIYTNKSILFFPNEEKICIRVFKNFIYLLEQSKKTNGILVYTNSITPKAQAFLTSLPFKIESFFYRFLLYNPTKHIKVPKHSKLHEIKKELPRINLKDLPEILSSDPIVKFYGFDVGDVIKIDRSTEIFYRRVVKDDI